MDPWPIPISHSDVDLIPFPLNSPNMDSQIEATATMERSAARQTLQNPNLNLAITPAASVRLSAVPDDASVLSEYRRLSPDLFSSFLQRLRRTSNGAFAGTSSADVEEASTSIAGKGKGKKQPRSAEMVRVSSVSVGDLVTSRDLVRRALITFDSLRSLLIRDEGKSESPITLGMANRPDQRAGLIMFRSNLCLNRDKRIIGSIPGIYMGDVFFYRTELCVVGLHGQTQGGIDYVAASMTANGEPVATSIVMSGGYEDNEDNGHELIYTGHGGRDKKLGKHNVDQKLEGGNLALERSMNHGIEIRVIRGTKSNRSPTGRVYIYDGLYSIVKCWPEVGKSSFGVYKFKLVRLQGQHEMGSVFHKLAEDLKKNPASVRPRGYLSLDISKGKEASPVYLFNDIDDDQDPLNFYYLLRPVYTRVASQERRHVNGGVGCLCVSNCNEDCYCAKRNGGEFAYDGHGIILQGRSLIYECGTSCKCPSSCANRVSQKRARYHFEVFRSMETGWGVRSLDLIPAGSFIFEYSGFVLTKEETIVASANGASLIYPNRFPARWIGWGDISNVFPEYVRPDSPCLPELSFSLDVSRVRNVACYVSHSSCPNVFLQFVLFDHYNMSFPHLMVFAMENIPPMRELSIDYGIT